MSKNYVTFFVFVSFFVFLGGMLLSNSSDDLSLFRHQFPPLLLLLLFTCIVAISPTGVAVTAGMNPFSVQKEQPHPNALNYRKYTYG